MPKIEICYDKKTKQFLTQEAILSGESTVVITSQEDSPEPFIGTLAIVMSPESTDCLFATIRLPDTTAPIAWGYSQFVLKDHPEDSSFFKVETHKDHRKKGLSTLLRSALASVLENEYDKKFVYGGIEEGNRYSFLSRFHITNPKTNKFRHTEVVRTSTYGTDYTVHAVVTDLKNDTDATTIEKALKRYI